MMLGEGKFLQSNLEEPKSIHLQGLEASNVPHVIPTN